MRVLVVIAVLAAVGCRADDLVKQGEVGEICNGSDDDCRPGLICASGLCAESGPGPTYDCADICVRLAACDATDAACESDCRISTTSWILRAREEFGVCLVEDLSCAEAQATFAPQLCYSRIEIPEDRFAVCESFARAAQTCGASLAEAERVLEGCAAVARVRADDVWSATAQCASAIETGICGQVATCFNRELELDPAIEFVTF